ncbi:MAG: hypothetical protein WCC54_11410, partial [Pseudolabrys sp.]
MLTNELAGYMASALCADVLKAADLFEPPPSIPRHAIWRSRPPPASGHTTSPVCWIMTPKFLAPLSKEIEASGTYTINDNPT